MTMPHDFGVGMKYTLLAAKAETIQAQANAVDEIGDFLDQHVKASAQEWEGAAAQAFRAVEHQWRTDIAQVAGALRGISGTMHRGMAAQQAQDRRNGHMLL
ncbi:WXG100 family type VII secretion target [Streptomyces sp. ACA25]|uniref:WXG100 family type VII secretion target n=1 Tax=Streptomyces sp. ACA25 TaxID=3022596 RepID=UPI0023079195|nr:WXG100 family type VII secretion target [Streptomyces sp. ACA25]MDB1089724.1 WXG100 family type VII secretion target [Streptomyces sp. ACA25]